MTDPPAVKAELPFKIVPGKPVGYLECEEVVTTVAGEKKMPFRIMEGYRGYKAIVELMKMYWTLEATVTGLTKERDEARAEYQKIVPRQEKMLKDEEIERRQRKGK